MENGSKKKRTNFTNGFQREVTEGMPHETMCDEQILTNIFFNNFPIF